MTTILGVYHKGRFISNCDKRCYDAMQPTELKEYRRDCCSCVCGGANHGVGFNKAILNRQRDVGLTRKDAEQFAAEREVNVDDLLVIDRLVYRKELAVRALVRAHFAPPPLPLFECEGTDLGSSGQKRMSDNGEYTSLHSAGSEGSVVQGRGGRSGVPHPTNNNRVARRAY
jgi:hypothetical protein